MSLPADNYIVSRSASEADRLEVQHRCIISCQGYYLHPDVSIPTTAARIAEIGTGTGIWLREVASAHPTAECHGFDISNVMFPNPETLASNIRLHVADMKKPFECSWSDYFDVVHLRMVQAAMTVEDWPLVLRNMTTLLKPGGWLQWYEDDRAVAVRHSFRPIAPLGTAQQSLLSNSTSSWRPPHLVDLSSFNRVVMPDDRALAMNFGYMNLDTLMADPEVGNLENVACDGFVIDREDDGGALRKAWAEMGISAVWSMIKAWEDAGTKVTNRDRNEWSDRSMKEIEAGAHWVSRATVFIGRKEPHELAIGCLGSLITCASRFISSNVTRFGSEPVNNRDHESDHPLSRHCYPYKCVYLEFSHRDRQVGLVSMLTQIGQRYKTDPLKSFILERSESCAYRRVYSMG